MDTWLLIIHIDMYMYRAVDWFREVLQMVRFITTVNSW
jgi:hypothetical protein